jgi:hypothetical protein
MGERERERKRERERERSINFLGKERADDSKRLKLIQ